MHKFGAREPTYLIKGLNRASDLVIVQEYKQTATRAFRLVAPSVLPQSSLFSTSTPFEFFSAESVPAEAKRMRRERRVRHQYALARRLPLFRRLYRSV